MEVQILSQKLIKPSIPTPYHLRTMKISFIDQLAPRVYISLVLYYPANHIPISDKDESYNLLEKSLSETLTLYYPLAGKFIPDRNLISCNDEGALYIEAKVNNQLDQFLLREPDAKLLNSFIPFGDEIEPSSFLLAVQINKFECGGLAIGVRLSHKVADGAACDSFINAWATACRAGINEVHWPSFDGGSVFPARDVSHVGNSGPAYHQNIVTKRFIFNKDAISTLKAIAKACACDFDVKLPPSRVKVVTALIWKAIISMAQEQHGQIRPSFLISSLNFRRKTGLPIAENSSGNAYRMVVTKFKPKGSNVQLHELLSLFSDSLDKANQECAEAKNSDDVVAMVTNSMIKAHEEFQNESNVDICVVSSWCRFGFYEADFGWGKPSWFSSVHEPFKLSILVDTKCGSGIEAWVNMEEKNMLHFQQDKDIMGFTSKLKQHELARH